MPVSGRTTSFKILHPLNAFSEISVNPSGIITFSRNGICAKAPVSATDKIVEHYKTICKTNDSSVIRNEIAELDKLSKDASISEQERMLAQYTYNLGYGVAKVDLSGKAVSVFDFPEIELLSATIGLVAQGEMEMDQTMIDESIKFLQKVEKFLQ